MAFQPETAVFDSGVYQIETIDPVQGGVNGLANRPLLALANRTMYLKAHMDAIENGTFVPANLATKNSPVFTGDPQAPTPALGDNDTSLATSAFVQGTVNGVLTKSVAGGVNVTLSAVEAGSGIFIFTGALTANIAVIVPNSGKQMLVINRTSGAFSLTVKTAAGGGVVVAQGKQQELGCDGSSVIPASNDFAGIVIDATATVPNAAIDTNTQQIASTAFVLAQASALTPIMNGIAAIGAATRFARSDHVHPFDTSRASLASPIFTGDPQAPTPAQFDNDTSLATTAFVRKAGCQFSGTVLMPANGTIPAANAGALTIFTGTTTAATLPALASVPLGGVITLFNVVNGNVVLSPGAGDFISVNSGTVASLTLGAGDNLCLVNHNGTNWEAIGGTAQLPYSAAIAGANFTTAPLLDNTAKLATTAFVRKAAQQFAGAQIVGANRTLANQDLGLLLVVNASVTIGLPPASAAITGQSITIQNATGAGFINIAAAGTDTINSGNGTAGVFAIQPGDSAVLVCFGPTQWAMLGTGALQKSASFAATYGGIGYQKLPSGVIVQWGSATSDASGVLNVGFPIAFPNAPFTVVTTPGSTSAGTFCVAVSGPSKTLFTVVTSQNNGVIALSFYWIAIGY